MTKDEALDLALEALENQRIFTLRPDHEGKELTPKQVTDAITAIKQARSALVQEPFGYLFQHEETGLTTVVDVQQVDWGFEKNNPRHQKIGPVYTTPPAAPVQPVMTDEKGRPISFWGGKSVEPIKQPAPASWMETVTANLVREGVNKHKARELAEHFYGLAQRTWVGLTDEDRTEIRREHYARTLPLMDAVEAKLRSKNNENAD